MKSLMDTNILVYRFDPRDPGKQAIATRLLETEIQSPGTCIAHQSIMEFIAATTRQLPDASHPDPLLQPDEAAWEAEELMRQFTVLYPNEDQLRLAVRGWRTYGLSWFDAHLWSMAEHHRITRLYSEDFQHNRVYGRVKVINPFI